MNVKNLRPKKTYGTSLRNNRSAVADMIQRRQAGQTFSRIGDAWGVTKMHVWNILKEAQTTNDPYPRN